MLLVLTIIAINTQIAFLEISFYLDLSFRNQLILKTSVSEIFNRCILLRTKALANTFDTYDSYILWWPIGIMACMYSLIYTKERGSNIN